MRVLHKFFRCFLVFLILLGNIPAEPAVAAAVPGFAGYGNENMRMEPVFWDLSNAEFWEGSLVMYDASASASFALDISSIAAAVDQGGLEIAFSAAALIMEPGEAFITVGFGSGGPFADSSFVLNRGMDRLSEALPISTVTSIPPGTRYIVIAPGVSGPGAEFSAFSLVINDAQNPSLTYSLAPAGWTNGPVDVTVTASDGDSGIAGIYDNTNTLLTSSASYTFQASGNNSWTFSTRDNAGKASAPLEVSVTTIDTNAPAAAVLTTSTEGWTTSPVEFSLSEVSSVAGESPVIRQYRLNGADWLEYAAAVTVSAEGSTLIEARSLDAAGNASDTVTGSVRIDHSAPRIEASYTANPQPVGGAAVTATISDDYTSVVTRQYATGSQGADFFQSGQGADLVGGQFSVMAGGPYTIYAVDELGNTALQEIVVNTYPQLSAAADQEMDEEGLLAVDLTAGDLETDPASLTVTAVSSNTALLPHPVVTNVSGAVSLALAPALNASGSAAVTVSVTDAGGLTTSTVFAVLVNDVNDLPAAGDDSAGTSEDNPVTIPVLANDTDVEGGALTVTAVTQPASGSVTITDAGQTVTYTPIPDFTGEESFTYTVIDPLGGEDSASVSVTTSEVNDPPVFTEVADQAISEDSSAGPLAFRLTDVDTAENLLALQASSSNQAVIPDANITLQPLSGGDSAVTVQPLTDANTFGIDPVTITLSASDGEHTVTETFTVTVSPVNDVPTAAADTAAVAEDQAVTISVLANDTDTEGEALTVTAVSDPPHGAAVIDGGLTIRYTPDANYHGTDTFTYTIRDATGGISTAQVTVTVSSVNDLPSGTNDSAAIDEDAVTILTVLNNDVDIDRTDGDAADEQLTIITVSGPSNGAAVITGDGQTVTYTPNANYSGTDSFTYTFRDVAGAEASASVNLTIRPVNDLPQYTNLAESYPVNEDESITITFDVSDVETPTESLMMQVVSGSTVRVPAGGLVLSGLGNTDSETSLQITPAANQNGPVTITLRLGDGFLVSERQFILDIAPVNDNPAAVDDSLLFQEDESIVIDMDDLPGNDTDIDGDTLVFAGIVPDSLADGTLTLLSEAEHTYTFTPPANFDAATTFEYLVSDGTVTDTGRVTLTARPQNDAPTITLTGSSSAETNEDTPLALGFTIHDEETPAASLSVQAGSSNADIVAPDGVALSCAGEACTMTVTPAANKNTTAHNAGGPVRLTVSVSDGVHLSETFVDLTINPMPDAPVAVPDVLLLEENGVASVSPLANDYDPDGDPINLVGYHSSGMSGSLVDHGGGTFTYTAAAQFTGDDPFTYTISDGSQTAEGLVTFTVSNLDNPPAITGVADQFIREDEATPALAFTVSDPDTGDALTVSAVSGDPTLFPEDAAHLLVTETVPGSGAYAVTVSPAADASGSALITLTVSDGAHSASTSFRVTVYPVNDPPLAVDDDLSLNEDTSLVFNPLANDSDKESPLKIIAMTSPTRGRLSAVGTTFTYTPYGNAYGADSFTYTITDGESTAQAAVNLTVVSVNDAPAAYDNWVEIPNSAGQSLAISVMNNDGLNGDSGETLRITRIVTPPQFGTAVISGDQVTYTRTSAPADTRDSFVYEVSDRPDGDPTARTDTATVWIAEDWQPSVSAENVWIGINEDAPLTAVNLAGAVHDGFGGGLTLSLDPPSTLVRGAASLPDPLGKIVNYTPNADANGSETIHYSVASITNPASTDTANIYITIYPVNDAPTISPVSDITIDEDGTTGSISVTIGDVDAEHPAADLVFEAFALNEALVLDRDITVVRDEGDITLDIRPIPNRFGSSVILLLASDGIATTTREFTLNVSPVNDDPLAPGVSTSLYEDSEKTVTVLAPNADVDGDDLTVAITTPPAYGTAQVNGDFTITYVPFANSDVDDSLVFTVDDGSGGTGSGTLSLDVVPVNDPPAITALAHLVETQEDTPVETGLTLADVDHLANTLSVSFVSSAPALLPVSAISMSGEGAARTLRLSPAANASGAAQITVRVSDGSLSEEQSFQLTVSSVNDLPAAGADAAMTNEDAAKIINVIANDSDIEDPSLVVVSMTNPANGTVTNNRDGTLTYRPAANWSGTDTFTYTIVDDNDGRATAAVTVTVNPVNDPPSAAADSASTLEDTNVLINLLGNDSDVENDPITLTAIAQPTHGQVTYDDQAARATYDPDDDFFGTDIFTYTLSDGQDTSTGSVSVTVSPENDAPRISSPVAEPWTMDEDTVGTFAFRVVDPETPSDNLVIRITSSDQTILPDTSIKLQGSGENKELQLTTRRNAFGSLVIRIEATDGVKTSAEEYDVLVRSVNDLPTITALSDRTIAEDGDTGALAFTVADTETAAASLLVTAATGDGTLLPVERVTIAAQAGGARTVAVRPGIHRNGAGTVTLTVTDADAGTASTSFTVTVTPSNDPPAAANDTASVAEDGSVVVDVLANDTDPELGAEGDNLIITARSGVDNGAVTIAGDQKSLTFAPALHWVGTETFQYTIRDTAGLTSTASVTVTVTPVNDPPAGVNNTATTNEDTPVTFNVIVNDTDPDLVAGREGDNLVVVGTSGVENGTAAIVVGGKSLTFTPAANWFGEEDFTYTLEDKEHVQSTASVRVTVISVNDPPAISVISNQTIAEDDSVTGIAFTVSDVDHDPSTLSVTASSSSTNVLSNGPVPASSFTITNQGGQNRSLAIAPLPDRNTWNRFGEVDVPLTVTMTVSDGALSRATTFNVSVTPLNDWPDSDNDTGTTPEDTALTLNVLANDDVDLLNEGDNTLRISEVTQPAHGAVAIIESGARLTYTPAANWNSSTDGADTFIYTALDVNGLPSTAIVAVTVSPVNDPPDAQDDTGAVDEDSFVDLTLLDNDTDLDLSREGDNLLITGATSLDYGSALGINAGKGLRFFPQANWSGTEVFTYTIRDAAGMTDSASITVTVNPLPDSPSAQNDALAIDEDAAVEFAPLANDGDVDLPYGDALTLVSVESTANLAALVNPDDTTLTLTPRADWNGVETLDYLMQDATGRQASATITVTVRPVNDDPLPADDSAETPEDTQVAVLVLANDADVDLDVDLNAVVTQSLVVTSVTQPAHGASAVGAGGLSVTYTPDANWNGRDSFTCTVSDGAGGLVSAQVDVRVRPENDGPAAVSDTASVNEGGSVAVLVLDNDTDVDLDADLNLEVTDSLYVSAVGAAAHGTVAVDSSELTVVYSPTGEYNGPDTFTYTVSDGAGLTSTGTVSVSVAQVYDAPQPVSDDASTAEDAPVTVAVLVNDLDVDLDPVVNQDEVDLLTVHFVSEPQHGAAAANPDSTVTYTPAANFNGVDTFTYTVIDRGERTGEASVTVTVGAVNNDPPAARPDTASLDEDQSVVVDPLANDEDPDLAYEGDNLTVVEVAGVDHGAVTIADNGKTLTFKPAADWNGEETFTYTMRDAAGERSSSAVTVTVRPVNDVPLISAVADMTMAEDTTSAPIAFAVTDVDNDHAGLVVTAASGNAALIAASGVSVTSTGGSGRAAAVTPLANKNTSGKSPVIITLTVSDGALTAAETFAVTVTPANDPPAAANDAAEMDENETITIDVLANDTDLDTAVEGDTFTVTALSGVDNARVQIVDGGKKVSFQPDGNWTGAEVFTYTMRDAAGAQASALVTVTVREVPDPPAGNPIGSFTMLTPRSGERYKDGQTVTVTWTVPTGADLRYTLEFFDGSAWVTLANNLTSPRYEHKLVDTRLHTPAAHYRARAWNASAAQVATGQTITIDNRAPENVLLSLRTGDGQPYQTGAWTNQPVRITAAGGWDLTGLQISVSAAGRSAEMNGGQSGAQTLEVSQPGEHTLIVTAVDPLGNQAVIGEVIVRIDTQPPAQPQVILVSQNEPGGALRLQFQDDPGKSGNQFLILPDGAVIPAQGEITWTPEKSGVYTLILVDQAGNRTPFEVTITLPEQPAGSQAPAAGETAPGAPSGQPSSGGPLPGGGSIPARSLLAGAACALPLFGLLLLLLYTVTNVWITTETIRPDGSVRRSTRRRWVIAPRSRALTFSVTEADRYSVRFSSGLTRSMRGGSVTLTPSGGPVRSAAVPDDQSGSFTADL